MAEWVQARSDLHTDPVVVRQARTLGMDAELVAFKWVRVWAWAREHTADGFVPDATFDDVDAVVGVPGFCAAAPRWVAEDGSGVRFPKWDRHNGNGARERFLNAERQRLSRSRRAHVTETVTAPLPEEKRREETVNKENRVRARETSPKLPTDQDASPEAVVWHAFDPVLRAMYPNGWRPDKFIARLNDLGTRLIPQTPADRIVGLLADLAAWLPTTKCDSPQGAIGLLANEWARCLDTGQKPGVRTGLAPIVSAPTQYTTAPVDQSKNIAAMEAALNRKAKR